MTDPQDQTEGLPSERQQLASLLAELEGNWRRGDEAAVRDFLERAAEGQRKTHLDALLAREQERYERLGRELGIGGPSLTSIADDAAATCSLRGNAQDDAKSHSHARSSQIPVRGWDDYEVLHEIARGGMGVVFKARQISLNRVVALKMILSGQLAGEEEVRRFRAEAEAAANLAHPGIVPIFEIGEHNGQPYCAMGFVEGRSLAARLADGPLPPREAAALVRKTAQAAAYAHEQGVIHRDLKPGNVLLDAAGEPRVTDFGLAKRMGEDSGLTATGQILGTPSYMPPEQALGLTPLVDQRSDVYALGAILYATLTGRPPHQAANLLDTIKAVIEQEPVAPRKLDRSLPRDLETICLKAIAKEPDRRYRSASALSDDLDRYLNNEPIAARRVGPLEKAWLWRRRHPRAAWSLAAAVMLLMLGALGAYQWRVRLQATALVDNLIQASVDDVPDIADRLQPYLRWARPQLQQLLSLKAMNDLDRRRQLHVRIGLAASEPQHHEALRQALLDDALAWEYLEVVGDVLRDARADFTSRLWEVLRDASQPDPVRFRAGLVLSKYQPHVAGDGDSLWREPDGEYLIVQYLAANPEFHAAIRGYLEPSRSLLREALATAFGDQQRSKAEQVAAATAVAQFYARDFEYLFPLLLSATSDQYLLLFGLVKDSDALDARLLAKAQEQPAEELGSLERLALGQQRANAAITLLRKGRRREVLDVLKVVDDPEAMTQFVHRCRARGVSVAELLELWDLLPQLAQRSAMEAAERRLWDSRLFGVLLALGEYPWSQVPPDQQPTLQSEVADLFRDDKGSGVHAAAGWLLRTWGSENPELAQLAAELDQRQVPQREDWEWYTTELEVEQVGGLLLATVERYYQTYVVFEAGEHRFGSPEDEPERQSDELLRTRRLDGFAVLDRELTRGEMEASGLVEFSGYEAFSESPAHAMVGPNWYDNVRYCRWLSERLGLGDRQAYADLRELDPQEYERDRGDEFTPPGARNWPLDISQSGFRLPTEHEWVAFARSGLRTAYSFGGDANLVDHYGWFGDNSGRKAHVPRELRPNLRGLFDTHGNAIEWCHDWFGDFGREDSATGPSEGTNRVMHGGGWDNTPRDCRSAARYWLTPSNRGTNYGVRVLRSSVALSQK